MTIYSPKEKKLITFFKLEAIAQEVSPVQVFQIMFKNALVHAIHGEMGEATLRYIVAAANIAMALDEGVLSRNSPEWEDMIGDI